MQILKTVNCLWNGLLKQLGVLFLCILVVDSNELQNKITNSRGNTSLSNDETFMLKEISLRNRKQVLRVPNSNRNIETRSLTNQRTYSLKAVFFLNKPIFETSITILPAVSQTFNIIFGQKEDYFFVKVTSIVFLSGRLSPVRARIPEVMPCELDQNCEVQ